MRTTAIPVIVLLMAGAGLQRAEAQCEPDPNDGVTDCDEPADLAIFTAVGSPTVQAGETFTYYIIVKNYGPGVAVNPLVNDAALTSWMDFIRANGCSLAVRTDGGLIDEFSCNFALSTGVFCLAQMGANHLNPVSTEDSGTIIITLQATADQDVTLQHFAEVISDCPDPDMSNNTATAMVMVNATSDLSVTKTATGEVQDSGQPGLIFDINNPGDFPAGPNYTTSPTSVTAGRRIAYQIEVANNGPSNTENVVVRDRLPAGVTIVPGTLSAEIFDESGALIETVGCETGTPGNPLDLLECGLGKLHKTEAPVLDDGENVARVRAEITFHVRVDTDILPGTVLENDVSVSSDNLDLDNSNNLDNTQTIVNTWADMEITKLSVGQNITGYDTDLRRDIVEDLAGQVTAGMDLRYEITVQNNGASDAQNVQILDLLPGQTSTGLDHDPVVFVSADGAECRPLDEQQEFGVFGPPGGQFGQVVWCDLGTIPAGARRTFDIYVTTDPSIPDGTDMENGAFVWWGASSPPAQPGDFLGFPFPQIPPELPTTDDSFLDDNFFATTTSANAVADVDIQKVDVPERPDLDQAFEPDLAIAGEEHRYLITISNEGPSVGRDIAVQDFLDFKQFGVLGEVFMRCEPFDVDDFVACSENNGVVDVDLLLKQNEQVIPGNLNPSDELSFYLITQVSPAYVLDADDFVATNDSRITTTTTDFHTADNVDAHDSLIVAEADLMVEKTDDLDGADPIPGQTVTYEITVTNLGASDAAEVLLTDYLPAEGFVLDPNMISVSLDGVPLMDCDTPLDPGVGDICYVNGNGRIQVIVGNDPDCQNADEIGRLNSGNSAVVTVEVKVGDNALRGIYVNEAWVETRQNDEAWPPAPDLVPGVGGGPRTPTADPNPDNNHDEVRYILDDLADLRIVKFGKPDGDVQAGDVLTYTVIVDNLGPDTATEVAIKDLMQTDGDFDVLSVESDRAMTCSSLPAADGGSPYNVPPDNGATTGVSERFQLDCTLDDPLEVLEADGPPNTGRWIITMRVQANELQDIDNVADVVTAVTDPNPANNHAEVEHAINDVADLAIAKVANPDQGPPNGLVTYEITVTNNGPSTADNVVVTDNVPAEFAISSVIASQGVCDAGTPGDPTDPTICLLGTIAAGDSATIEIGVVLPPDEVDATYFNRATVVGEQYDPNNSNNLAVAPVTVVVPAPQTQPSMGLCGGMSMAPMGATMIGMIGFVGLRRRTRRKAA